MISKEIKKFLKDNYSWEIVTESPLKILNIYDKDDYYTGLMAQKELDEAIEALEDEKMSDWKEQMKLLKTMNDDDMLLVTADEFNIIEYQIMTVGEYKEIHTFLCDYEYEIEWSFGTNEEMRFDSGTDLLASFVIKKISKEDAEVISRVIGENFGSNGVFDYIAELPNESDDNDDNDDDDEEIDYDALFEADLAKAKAKFATIGWSVERVDDTHQCIFKSDDGSSQGISNLYYKYSDFF